MKIAMLSVPARATATSRLRSPLKSPTAIADGSSPDAGSTSASAADGGLEGPVAGTQVDAVRGHDVEDAVVGEVADGDRRVIAALFKIGGSRRLTRVGRRRE